jgi:uncharacterized protein (DUF2141 family)
MVAYALRKPLTISPPTSHAKHIIINHANLAMLAYVAEEGDGDLSRNPSGVSKHPYHLGPLTLME